MSGKLRVTGGRLVRRQFDVPPAADRGAVRPTSDRVREALFSALSSQELIDGARVLDVFAGSGALGIESLSRGASTCTFVERHRATASVLRSNLRELELLSMSKVIEKDALRALAQLPSQAFEIVFADPPYALDVDLAWMECLLDRLVVGGRLVIERAKKSEGLPTPNHVKLLFDRSWGQTRVSIFAPSDR